MDPLLDWINTWQIKPYNTYRFIIKVLIIQNHISSYKKLSFKMTTSFYLEIHKINSGTNNKEWL